MNKLDLIEAHIVLDVAKAHLSCWESQWVAVESGEDDEALMSDPECLGCLRKTSWRHRRWGMWERRTGCFPLREFDEFDGFVARAEGCVSLHRLFDKLTDASHCAQILNRSVCNVIRVHVVSMH